MLGVVPCIVNVRVIFPYIVNVRGFPYIVNVRGFQHT